MPTLQLVRSLLLLEPGISLQSRSQLPSPGLLDTESYRYWYLVKAFREVVPGERHRAAAPVCDSGDGVLHIRHLRGCPGCSGRRGSCRAGWTSLVALGPVRVNGSHFKCVFGAVGEASGGVRGRRRFAIGYIGPTFEITIALVPELVQVDVAVVWVVPTEPNRRVLGRGSEIPWSRRGAGGPVGVAVTVSESGPSPWLLFALTWKE